MGTESQFASSLVGFALIASLLFAPDGCKVRVESRPTEVHTEVPTEVASPLRWRCKSSPTEGYGGITICQDLQDNGCYAIWSLYESAAGAGIGQVPCDKNLD